MDSGMHLLGICATIINETGLRVLGCGRDAAVIKTKSSKH